MIRLTLFLALLLGGCTTASDENPLDRLPRQVRSAEVGLASWEMPEQLGDFRLQGSIVSDNDKGRLLHYAAPNDATLRIALYPFPGGWDELDPDRVVGGHYAQLRQQEINRLERRGAVRVRISGEQLREGMAGWPVAEVLLTGYTRTGQPLGELLLLTGTGSVFVRLIRDDAHEDHREEMRQLLDRFVEHLPRP